METATKTDIERLERKINKLLERLNELTPNDEWISLAQAASMLPYDYFTVRRMVVDQGRVPYIRPNGKGKGKIAIRRADLPLLATGSRKKQIIVL